MRPRSLRGRVMVGAVLWTIGLFTVITITFTFSMHARETAIVVHSHTGISVIVALLCLFGGLALVRAGLAPLDDMRRRLSDVRKGIHHELPGTYPTEV